MNVNTPTPGTGMSITISGSDSDDAAHQAKVTAAADANVDVIAPAPLNQWEADPKTQSKIGDEERLNDDMALTAGGYGNLSKLFQYAETVKGPGVAKRFNAAMHEAIHGDTTARRHNARSRAQAEIASLKEEYSRKIGNAGR